MNPTFLALCIAAGGPSPGKSPAKVVHAPDGGTITLTEKAEQRLAITVGSIETKAVRDVLVRSAEIIAAPGASAPIVAPVTGTIVAPPGQKTLLLPGAAVTAGQVVMRLRPLVAPDRNLEVEAKRDQELARARLEMAEKRAARMKTLLAEGAVDVAALEQATTAHDVARAELTAANERLSRAKRNPMAADVSLSLRAPHDGVLVTSEVAIGQAVAAGARMFEVLSNEPTWVRVPVWAGALDKIDGQATASVTLLGSNERLDARRVDRPPLPGRGSAVTVFYAVTSKTDVRPGQRATIHLPIGDPEEERLVAPWAAILWDAGGRAWVYTKPSPLTYTRRRIEIDRIVGDHAVLVRGPPAGTTVATAGVAELFGTETGIGK